jgi:hypothetical protein
LYFQLQSGGGAVVVGGSHHESYHSVNHPCAVNTLMLDGRWDRGSLFVCQPLQTEPRLRSLRPCSGRRRFVAEQQQPKQIACSRCTGGGCGGNCCSSLLEVAGSSCTGRRPVDTAWILEESPPLVARTSHRPHASTNRLVLCIIIVGVAFSVEESAIVTTITTISNNEQSQPSILARCCASRRGSSLRR